MLSKALLASLGRVSAAFTDDQPRVSACASSRIVWHAYALFGTPMLLAFTAFDFTAARSFCREGKGLKPRHQAFREDAALLGLPPQAPKGRGRVRGRA